MTPTSFEFTLTLPGDPRLVGAVRALTSHAAGYAHLNVAARDDLASQVVAATEAAMASVAGADAAITLHFTGDDARLNVIISFATGGTPPPAPSTSSGHVSTEWTTEGSRHVCRIGQRLDV
jgi:hypothetical protein